MNSAEGFCILRSTRLIVRVLKQVANAIILPTVMEYNAEVTGEKYREIARAMGVAGVDNMTQEEYRKAAIDAMKKLYESLMRY